MVKATFLKTKDIGFDKKDGSGHLPGKALTAMDGTEYKLWGNSSKNVSVGTEYEFEAEGGKIDGKTFRPAGQAPSAPERDYEPPINQQKQTSIETQNAVTNTCNLWAAGKIEDDSLLAKNVLDYLASKLIIGSHKAQVKASPLVEAAVEMGGVVKEADAPGRDKAEEDAAQEFSLTLTTIGKLRMALGKLGLSTQEEQLRAIGVSSFDEVKEDVPQAYMNAWGAVNGG